MHRDIRRVDALMVSDGCAGGVKLMGEVHQSGAPEVSVQGIGIKGHSGCSPLAVKSLYRMGDGLERAPEVGTRLFQANDFTMDAILLGGKFEANKLGGNEVGPGAVEGGEASVGQE